MTDRRPAIGIDRKIRLTWLDTAAELVGKGAKPTEIRAQLDQALANEVAGEGTHGARGKTLTVLLHIWVLVPPRLRAFRDQGVVLLQQAPLKDRICLHWGMALATYPFFRDLATNIGRLLELQGNVTLSQLTRRMAESWGERTTLVRAVQRVARSMVEWGVLAESKEPGIYEVTPRQAVPSESAVWMLEALLRAGQLETGSFRQLIRAAAIFPFSISVHPASIRDHPRLEIGRQGLDDDILILRPDRVEQGATVMPTHGNPEAEEDGDLAEAAFFRGKRPWSKIKDQVLGTYMPAYLAKVAKLGRKIVLIDAFAGPGKFDDGAAGSPLIICQAAEKFAKDQYQAIFVNREKEFHDQLSSVLKPFIDQKKVIPILGTAGEFLDHVRRVLTDQTVFLYLDPFGLKGCEFATIEPFLARPKQYSTEMVVNLSVPTMHRLAARKAVAERGPVHPKVQSFHRRLTQILGGDYWQSILWDEGKDAETKADEVMEKYREKLVSFGLPYSGSCPVREREDRVIKYYITFCSRHPDAMLLMNDAMCTAYHQRMHEAVMAGTLFAGTDWKESRSVRALPDIVVELVAKFPGKSRSEFWQEIVQRHFMRYLASEYRDAVKNLVNDKRIDVKDVRGTGRLNDDTRLYPRATT